MILGRIPLHVTRTFSPLFLDYLQQRHHLRSFYNRFPDRVNFEQQIHEKKNSYSPEVRRVLCRRLLHQNADLGEVGAVSDNITALADANTFTVTTGHQLNIFTGPLYFIYKIITTINTCRVLQQDYPQYRFVPVFWMASEDHDADEICSVRIHGKTYTWKTDQQGATGRFSTAGLAELARSIPADTSLFEDAYSRFDKLSDAVRYYVHKLFGKYGLVVIDGDDRELKRCFVGPMEEDLLSHAAHTLVTPTNERLRQHGYTAQVYVRPVNLFYLDDQLRTRIEQSGENYRITGTSQVFSKTELRTLLHDSPERFSPNVVLRPLYQETLLPNLAYVGGPAEVAYWLQLAQLFQHFKTPFPILMPRNFALLMPRIWHRKWEKTGIAPEELFLPLPELINEITLRYAPDNIRLNGQKDVIREQMEKIQENARHIDASLNTMIAAETRRIIRSLEKIELKMLRAEKRKQADRLRQVKELKEALFPGGNLQERTENILTFTRDIELLVDQLITFLDPFDFRFYVIQLDD
jgi:bacillithiol biosynthesis cysteine-adding enzyme BshC